MCAHFDQQPLSLFAFLVNVQHDFDVLCLVRLAVKCKALQCIHPKNLDSVHMYERILFLFHYNRLSVYVCARLAVSVDTVDSSAPGQNSHCNLSKGNARNCIQISLYLYFIDSTLALRRDPHTIRTRMNRHKNAKFDSIPRFTYTLARWRPQSRIYAKINGTFDCFFFFFVFLVKSHKLRMEFSLLFPGLIRSLFRLKIGLRRE